MSAMSYIFLYFCSYVIYICISLFVEVTKNKFYDKGSGTKEEKRKKYLFMDSKIETSKRICVNLFFT